MNSLESANLIGDRYVWLTFEKTNNNSKKKQFIMIDVKIPSNAGKLVSAEVKVRKTTTMIESVLLEVKNA